MSLSAISNFISKVIGLDYAVFAVVVGAFGMGLFWWLGRRKLIKRGIWLIHLLILSVLAMAWWQLRRETQREWQRFEGNLAALAATYAEETSYLGHAELTLETKADDPGYLRLIEAQKRWLRANPQVNDIYTYRKRPDGNTVLFVDSETDYDKNGKIEGDTEARTAIGEIYDEKNPAIDEAFAGKTGFSREVITDRWGSWFSYHLPMYSKDGSVEGVIGLDVAAQDVLSTIARVRNSSLTQSAMLIFALLSCVGAAGAAMLAKHNEEQRTQAATMAEEKLRFENLVHSVDGVVWESHADAVSYAYVSPAAEVLFGSPCEAWLTNADFWAESVHPEDQARVKKLRESHIRQKSPYQTEYRFRHANGNYLRVRERGVPSGKADQRALRGVLTDVTEQQQNAYELEKTHRQLVETSRRAGMAEAATGVLHNVGNVLNSVNVCSTLLGDELRKSSLPVLKKVSQILLDQPDIGQFITADPRGKAIPGFLSELHGRLESEQLRMGREIAALTTNVDHMKEVVMMQQSYARMGGRNQPLDIQELVEDAVQINQAGLARHGIKLERQFEPVGLILAERNKVLQILVNLLGNAKHAVCQPSCSDPTIWIELRAHNAERVEITVRDNGVGISQEHMQRLFSYGFTTKDDGHGFGLHSSVNTAREMQGDLIATSDGEGRGACFKLFLPFVSLANEAATTAKPTISKPTTDLLCTVS